MLAAYRTVAGRGQAEVVIEKSIFIGYAQPVQTEEEARVFIAELKKKHRDATHHVPAYVLGEHHEIQRSSDDGEPSGTAGVPVLTVISKEGLHDVAVVVVRYFGGVKLGAGGLVRAYTKGAKLALEAAGIVERRLYEVMSVTIAYPLLGMVQNMLAQNDWEIKEIFYTDQVELHIWVADEQTADFASAIVEWTSGNVVQKKLVKAYREQPV